MPLPALFIFGGPMLFLTLGPLDELVTGCSAFSKIRSVSK